jgi:hypothetical protein
MGLGLSCKKATVLIEKGSVFQLKRVEKVQLMLHLKMCRKCKLYGESSKSLDVLIANEFKKKNESGPSISEAFKKELLERLKKDVRK